MTWFNSNPKKRTLPEIQRRLVENRKEYRELLVELEAAQNQCPHPPECQVVVSNEKGPYLSCNQCGKVLTT